MFASRWGCGTYGVLALGLLCVFPVFGQGALFVLCARCLSRAQTFSVVSTVRPSCCATNCQRCTFCVYGVCASSLCRLAAEEAKATAEAARAADLEAQIGALTAKLQAVSFFFEMSHGLLLLVLWQLRMQLGMCFGAMPSPAVCLVWGVGHVGLAVPCVGVPSACSALRWCAKRLLCPALLCHALALPCIAVPRACFARRCGALRESRRRPTPGRR